MAIDERARGDRRRRERRRRAIDLASVFADAGVEEVLQQLDRELIGLAPVKQRIADIAALLLVERARTSVGLSAGAPSLHMSFTGNPGTGKTTVALRMAQILHRLGYVRKGHLVAVTRDDLVGQYIGHTAPKTREILKKAMGGVLFIDEAYYLYRPENERDYGQEAIEILLQVMENQRDDLVVIVAGYKDRMDTFFRSNPGLSSRIAHHLDFPDYAPDELLAIAERMLDGMQYALAPAAREALAQYIARRRTQPHFANARSIRNALDRARLRQATRLFEQRQRRSTATALMTIEADDIRKSRVFAPDAAGAFALTRVAERPMPDREKTLTEFIIEEQRRFPQATGDFTALLNYVRLACKRISFLIGRGALEGVTGLGRRRQRAGRGAGQARRDRQRHLPAHERVRRPSRRHGVGGDGGSLRHSARVSARQVPARVRSARRLEQRRRQRVGRQHLLRAARARRRRPRPWRPTSCSRARGSCAPAMRSTARRRCWC